MKVFKLLSIVAFATVLFIGCNSKDKQTIVETPIPQEIVAKVINGEPNKGDKVPNNLACMVNDAYMGKEQLEVPFDGKMYYGCCEMCKERIPTDETVRYALDPQTLSKVDKANAYIVLIGDNDEVAYFENESNYKSFLKENKKFN